MKVAFFSNKSNVWLRRTGKDILSSLYLLLYRKKWSKNLILPEYDYLPSLLDPSAKEFSIFAPPPVETLREYDLLFWEWGWGIEGPRLIQEIRKSSDIPILMFPGPLDRFWREVSLNIAHEHLQAARLVNFVGAMLEDTIEFYQTLLPQAKVFHLPVPVDTNLFKHFAKPRDEQRRRQVLLTAPTLFRGKASQVPIATYVAFNDLLQHEPDLHGISFAYSQQERADAKTIFFAVGISNAVKIHNFKRPIFRYFKIVRSSNLALFLPNAMIQGRMSLVCACLGIPFVGSREIETHRRLFPETCVSWKATAEASKLSRRLLNDSAFFTTVTEKASQAVEYYNIENCRNRLMKGLSTCSL